MKQVDEETREILDSFIAEALERLDEAEDALSKLADGGDASGLGSVFRLFHSLKGSAAFLDLDSIRGLTHEAETLIDYYVKAERPPSQESLDIVYQTIDLLRALVGRVQASYGDDGREDAVAARGRRRGSGRRDQGERRGLEGGWIGLRAGAGPRSRAGA